MGWFKSMLTKADTTFNKYLFKKMRGLRVC